MTSESSQNRLRSAFRSKAKPLSEQRVGQKIQCFSGLMTVVAVDRAPVGIIRGPQIA